MCITAVPTAGEYFNILHCSDLTHNGTVLSRSTKSESEGKVKQRFQGEMLELWHRIRIHFAVSGFKMERYGVTLNSKSSNLLKVKKDFSKSEKAWRWSAWRWNTYFPPPCSSRDIYLSKFDNWIYALGAMLWNRGTFYFALSRIWVDQDAVTCDWKGSKIFQKGRELDWGKNEEGRCEANVKRFQGGNDFNWGVRMQHWVFIKISEGHKKWRELNWGKN